MKWIKASERLPSEKKVCFRWMMDEGHYAYSSGIIFNNLQNVKPDFEWLDESANGGKEDGWIYAVYSGCIYEGGGTDSVWSTKEAAIEAAEKMFESKEGEAKKLWEDDESFWWKKVELKEHWHEDLIAIWNNCIDEIKVIRYALNPLPSPPNSEQNDKM